ncbi:unnamed protein product [Calicophoron daubneyi]|uniref:Uncharacterized protein n=1 Tax=Calicophoron daubneyi TaxID=300641 RepID=A0AAV2TAA6_CALDB
MLQDDSRYDWRSSSPRQKLHDPRRICSAYDDNGLDILYAGRCDSPAGVYFCRCCFGITGSVLRWSLGEHPRTCHEKVNGIKHRTTVLLILHGLHLSVLHAALLGPAVFINGLFSRASPDHLRIRSGVLSLWLLWNSFCRVSDSLTWGFDNRYDNNFEEGFFHHPIVCAVRETVRVGVFMVGVACSLGNLSESLQQAPPDVEQFYCSKTSTNRNP